MQADGNYEEILSPNLYYDQSFDLNAVKILPGEYYVTARDMVLVTVLGTCVAACIRDRVSGIAGMNHFMLPSSRRDGGDPLGVPARYGVYAMGIMINELLKTGAKRNNLEAKVFGGGEVLRGFTVDNVGQRKPISCWTTCTRKISRWWRRTCSTSIRARFIFFRAAARC